MTEVFTSNKDIHVEVAALFKSHVRSCLARATPDSSACNLPVPPVARITCVSPYPALSFQLEGAAPVDRWVLPPYTSRPAFIATVTSQETRLVQVRRLAGTGRD